MELLFSRAERRLVWTRAAGAGPVAHGSWAPRTERWTWAGIEDRRVEIDAGTFGPRKRDRPGASGRSLSVDEV